jgi:hypothetical protein
MLEMAVAVVDPVNLVKTHVQAVKAVPDHTSLSFSS